MLFRENVSGRRRRLRKRLENGTRRTRVLMSNSWLEEKDGEENADTLSDRYSFFLRYVLHLCPDGHSYIVTSKDGPFRVFGPYAHSLYFFPSFPHLGHLTIGNHSFALSFLMFKLWCNVCPCLF
jgi:hypothetical protein